MLNSKAARLDPSEFLHLAPEKPNDQAKYNHDGCSAGLDTKRRLFIKRNMDGSVVAYCHHCGLSGFSRARGNRFGGSGSVASTGNEGAAADAADSSNSGLRYAGNGSQVTLPTGCTDRPSDWPDAATKWIREAGLTPEEVAEWGMVYWPRYNRLILPVYAAEGLLGYQSRRLDPDDGTPKYMTKVDKTLTDRLYYHLPMGTTTVVICEDALSAIRVVQDTGFSAVALLTTTVGETLRNVLKTTYKNAIVWLDDDNPHVRKHQMDIVRLLDPYMQVRLVATGKDPKRHTFNEIRKEIL